MLDKFIWHREYEREEFDDVDRAECIEGDINASLRVYCCRLMALVMEDAPWTSIKVSVTKGKSTLTTDDLVMGDDVESAKRQAEKTACELVQLHELWEKIR